MNPLTGSCFLAFESHPLLALSIWILVCSAMDALAGILSMYGGSGLRGVLAWSCKWTLSCIFAFSLCFSHIYGWCAHFLFRPSWSGPDNVSWKGECYKNGLKSTPPSSSCQAASFILRSIYILSQLVSTTPKKKSSSYCTRWVTSYWRTALQITPKSFSLSNFAECTPTTVSCKPHYLSQNIVSA